MSKVAKSRAALIIPALNEEAVIGMMLDSVPKFLYSAIVVADNGSTDQTAEIARRAGAIVVSEPERGYGAACLKALAALPADVDAVVFMQADCSEYPEEAELLLTPLYDGRADLVIGSRRLGWTEKGALLRHQIFGNWLATTLVRILFGYRYTDIGPYRAISLSALKQLNMEERNYGWTIEMQVRALQKNLRVLEVPVSYRNRTAGVNKVSGNWKASLQAGVKIIGTILRLRMFLSLMF